MQTTVTNHILNLFFQLNSSCMYIITKLWKMNLWGEFGLKSTLDHCQNYVNTTNHIKYKILKHSTNRFVFSFSLLAESEENATSACDSRRCVQSTWLGDEPCAQKGSCVLWALFSVLDTAGTFCVNAQDYYEVQVHFKLKQNFRFI